MAAQTTAAAPSAGMRQYQAALTNALLNPNMPVEQQFSTGSARTDAEVLRRAQIATALSNAQAAIQERRNLQAMQAGMSPTGGVQQVGGTRVAFRNGVPVGIAQDTGVAPQRVQGQTGPSVLSPEQAQANRMRIAELAQQATARDAAARALMGARPAPAATAPVASAARVAPVAAAALPVTVARPAQPMVEETMPVPGPAIAPEIEQRLQEIEAGPTEEQAAATAAKAQRLQTLRQQYEQLGRLLQSGQTARPKLQTGQSYTTMGQTVLQPANRDEMKRAAAQYRQLRDQIAALSEELGESNP